MTGRRISMLVTADDSTGATEAGAACADVGLHVYVIPIGATPAAAVPHDSCVVIDLRSRHETAAEARRRITATTTDAHRVHKIDSTLRGNWAAEASALVDSGRRVVMIPSHPLVGRVCAGGVVYVNGVPVRSAVALADGRRGMRSANGQGTRGYRSGSWPGSRGLATPGPLAGPRHRPAGVSRTSDARYGATRRPAIRRCGTDGPDDSAAHARPAAGQDG